jgi:hypothetical protein
LLGQTWKLGRNQVIGLNRVNQHFSGSFLDVVRHVLKDVDSLESPKT